MIWSHAVALDWYSLLMRVRPAQLGDVLKRLLRIQRREMPTASGQVLWADPVSILGSHLRLTGLHEPQLTHIVASVLRPGDTFLDVGGNEGYFSVLAASRVGDGAVHCIEPQRRLLPVLEKNRALNRAANMHIHILALAERDGVAELYLRPSSITGASSFYRHWKLGHQKDEVACTTLATFVAQQGLARVRLMKVDCEGAEHQVVSGGTRFLEAHGVELIALEYHPSISGVEACDRTHERLRSLGYVCSKVNGNCLYHLPGLEEELRPLGQVVVDCPWNAESDAS